MQIFQNLSVYSGYLARLNRLCNERVSYKDRLECFLEDRYSATHILDPIISKQKNGALTICNDPILQKRWAQEHGMSNSSSLAEILLCQIEEHRTEIFYNDDPVLYDSSFIKKLPGCVRVKVAWRAAPSKHMNFQLYDRVVCNFPGILKKYETMGFKTAYFYPAHDPVMDKFAANIHRPVDILFVGSYGRHHTKRAKILETIACLKDRYNVVFHLELTRLNSFAESFPGKMLPLHQYRRPDVVRSISQSGIFGIELYSVLSRAKIVINNSIDLSGIDRGNMRCWEAMGCGSLMISDTGNYPPGMTPGVDFDTYSDCNDIVLKINKLFQDQTSLREKAQRGYLTISNVFTKKKQWQAFVEIISKI